MKLMVNLVQQTKRDYEMPTLDVAASFYPTPHWMQARIVHPIAMPYTDRPAASRGQHQRSFNNKNLIRKRSGAAIRQKQ
jgi:hypothetical protein